MQTARLTPVVLSFLVLAAHLSRAGLPLAAVAAVALLPGLLVSHRRWAVRALQVGLVLATLEWVRTTVRLAAVRRAEGEPYLRLLAILGVVIGVSAISVPLLESWRRHRRGVASRPAEASA